MRSFLISLVAVLCSASLAHAAAPEPRKPVETQSYTGRWFEIARIPNRLQRGCLAPHVDYTLDGLKVRAVQRCAPTASNRNGRVYRSSGRILDPGTNAKVRLTFAGFWSQDYWIVDHDPAAGWALVGDPAGRWLWVMFRDATPPTAARDAAVARVGALGYDTRRLEFAGARR
jgi:apolipoprotein D and lipocalin family protein